MIFENLKNFEQFSENNLENLINNGKLHKY